MRLTIAVIAGLATSLICSSQAFPQSKPSSKPGDKAFVTGAEYAVQKYDYPDDGAVVGQGWDSYRRRKTGGLCVAADTDKIKIHTQDLRLRRVLDKEHIFRSLSVATSGKYETGVFSAGGSGSFARSVSIDTSALNIAATLKVDTGGEFLKPKVKDGSSHGAISLTDEALQLLAKNEDDFQKVCGDSYIIAIRTGARADAVLTFKTYDYTSKLDLYGTFRASYMGGSGKGTTKQKESKDKDKEDFRFHYLQSGGDPSSMPLTADELLEKLKGFGKRDQQFIDRAYEVHTLSYNSLPGYAATVSQRRLSPAEFDEFANHYWRLVNLAKEYTQAADTDEFLHHAFEEVELMPGRKVPGERFWIEQERILLAAGILNELMMECLENYDCDIRSALPKTLQPWRSLDSKTFDILVSSAVRATLLSAIDPASAQADDDGYYWYYRWLAMKPLRLKGGDNEKPEIDLNTLLTENGRKALTAAKDEQDVQKILEVAAKQLREQLLYSRLLPLSISFCDESTSHPMCLSAMELREIVNDVPISLGRSDFSGVGAGKKKRVSEGKKHSEWVRPPEQTKHDVKKELTKRVIKSLPGPKL